MKQKSLILILAMFVVSLLPSAVIAQIPGKTYQPGDTIQKNGMTFAVYKVDESGLHGSAFYAGMDPKTKEKTIKTMEEHIKPLLAKGEMSEDEYNTTLEMCKKSIIDVIPREKVKKGMVYRIDQWLEQLPEGLRVPTTQDAEDFAMFYCEGLGRGHRYALTQAFKLTSDIYAQNIFSSISSWGMIISDSNSPEDVKFLIHMQNGINQNWFEIKDKYAGNEQSIAVFDF